MEKGVPNLLDRHKSSWAFSARLGTDAIVDRLPKAAWLAHPSVEAGTGRPRTVCFPGKNTTWKAKCFRPAR